MKINVSRNHEIVRVCSIFFPPTDERKFLRIAQGEQIHTFTKGTKTLKFA